MANLFWNGPKGMKALLETPFRTEEEFETAVFGSPELLKEIVLLKRQVRGGSKCGIPDIVGIDSEGTVCIVEMKNAPVDANIIPQVLQYAVWAQQNPDSIKTLWLQCENRPEDITVPWDNLTVRILVLAPLILRSALDVVGKINYPVDLIEVKRWVEGKNEMLLVNRLEQEPTRPTRPVSGRPNYDEAFYRSQRNQKSVAVFYRYCREVWSLVRRRKWDLEQKFNQSYCGFRAGFFNAFGIKWMNTKTLAFFVKLPEKDARKIGVAMSRYEKLWSEAIYVIEPGRTKVADFARLFEAAYKRLSGD